MEQSGLQRALFPPTWWSQVLGTTRVGACVTLRKYALTFLESLPESCSQQSPESSSVMTTAGPQSPVSDDFIGVPEVSQCSSHMPASGTSQPGGPDAHARQPGLCAPTELSNNRNAGCPLSECIQTPHSPSATGSVFSVCAGRTALVWEQKWEYLCSSLMLPRNWRGQAQRVGRDRRSPGQGRTLGCCGVWHGQDDF